MFACFHVMTTDEETNALIRKRGLVPKHLDFLTNADWNFPLHLCPELIFRLCYTKVAAHIKMRLQSEEKNLGDDSRRRLLDKQSIWFISARIYEADTSFFVTPGITHKKESKFQIRPRHPKEISTLNVLATLCIIKKRMDSPRKTVKLPCEWRN